MGKKSDKKLADSRFTIGKDQVSERVKDFLVRAHSFQEMGTEELPDEDYDVLHFPHLILAAGVIMAVYGYFIILVTTEFSAYQDGIVILIVGNVISTIGILGLLKKYWASFFILLLLSIGMIIGMMVLWDYVLFPVGKGEGFIPSGMSEEGNSMAKIGLVVLTTLTFAYTACFLWYLLARFTSSIYFKFFSLTKEKANRFFIVDPWRKTLASKSTLISDIINRVYVPFFFLLSIIMTLSSAGTLYFIQVGWSNYFETVLLTFFLICAMVVLFPAFWLLDYVRYYNEERLEVKSLGARILILVKGYAGFGTIFTFLARSQEGIVSASLEFYMLTLYLLPSLILLIGGYVLLTERDVYYIADKVVHGDKVIIEFKLIDSTGKELKWWLTSEENGGSGRNE